jgi:hypothetical protein
LLKLFLVEEEPAYRSFLTGGLEQALKITTMRARLIVLFIV